MDLDLYGVEGIRALEYVIDPRNGNKGKGTRGPCCHAAVVVVVVLTLCRCR
jgi:hypothetical protein